MADLSNILRRVGRSRLLWAAVYLLWLSAPAVWLAARHPEAAGRMVEIALLGLFLLVAAADGTAAILSRSFRPDIPRCGWSP